MKAPAYQWYPKDILSSARVAEMDLAEECSYRRALDFCWLNGSLPADVSKLSRIIGKGCTEDMAKVVSAMFIPCPDDATRMIHERLEQERAKQAEWNKKSSEGGKISAQKRAEAKARLDAEANQWHNQHPTTVEPPLQGWLPNGTNQTSTLQFASASPITKEKKEESASANFIFSEPLINPNRSNHCPGWPIVLRVMTDTNGTPEQAKAFFEYNEKNDWRNSRGQPIAFWQPMVNTWLSNDAERAASKSAKADEAEKKKQAKANPPPKIHSPTPEDILRQRHPERYLNT